MPPHTLLMFVFLAGFLVVQVVSFLRAWRHAARVTDDWRQWSYEAVADSVSTEEGVWRLDQLLARSIAASLLRRLTVIAPLLGVIVTAVGFITMSPTLAGSGSSESAAAVADTLAAIQPLFVGILLGAALSIENQAAVLFLQRRVDHARQSVLAEWIDRRPSVPIDGTGQLALELRGMVDALCEATQRLTADGQAVSGALQGILDHAAQAVRRLAESCHESADSLRHAAELHGGAVASAVPRIEASVRELADRVEAGASVVESQVEQSCAITKEMSDQLKRAMSNSGKSFSAAIDRGVELFERRFDGIASEVDRRASESAARSEKALAAILDLAEPVTAAVPHLRGTVETIAGRIASIEERERQVADLAESASKFASATTAISGEAVGPLRDAVTALTEQCMELQSAVIALRQAGDELRAGASRTRQVDAIGVARSGRQRGEPPRSAGSETVQPAAAIGTDTKDAGVPPPVQDSRPEHRSTAKAADKIVDHRDSADSDSRRTDEDAPAPPIPVHGRRRSILAWFRGR